MLYNPPQLYKYTEYEGKQIDNVFAIIDVTHTGLHIIQRVKHLFWRFYIEEDRSFGTWAVCLDEIIKGK